MTPPEDKPLSREERLEVTVGMVWRDQRVSCPHADILRSYVDKALSAGAMDYLRFHIEECRCPYCGAVVDEVVAREADTGKSLKSLKDRLMRSTAVYLRSDRKD